MFDSRAAELENSLVLEIIVLGIMLSPFVRLFLVIGEQMRFEKQERLLEAQRAEKKRKKQKKQKPETRPYPREKPAEVFFESSPEQEQEPAGKHVYDPASHRVIWVPA